MSKRPAAGIPNIQTEPTGFDQLSKQQVIQEARIAEINDSGQPSSLPLASRTVTKDTLITKSLGYSVEEEQRSNPFGDNSSLQSVLFRQHFDKPGAEARLTSIRDEITSSLTGHSDGRVMLSVHKDRFTYVDIDITKLALDVGITAAGIRRTQKDIAQDGEVLRPEQERIIDMIDRAKSAADIKVR